jgi:hypothetical protein
MLVGGELEEVAGLDNGRAGDALAVEADAVDGVDRPVLVQKSTRSPSTGRRGSLLGTEAESWVLQARSSQPTLRPRGEDRSLRL